MNAGLLCRCSVCGREERAGSSPLSNGWPKCCGYTMMLIDTERFMIRSSQKRMALAVVLCAMEEAAYAGDPEFDSRVAGA